MDSSPGDISQYIEKYFAFKSRLKSLFESEGAFFFDRRIEGLHLDKQHDHVVNLVIGVGQMTLAKNLNFIHSLKQVGDSIAVEFGEVGVSRLTDRFASWNQLGPRYLFFYTQAISKATNGAMGLVTQLISGETVKNSPIITIGGPLGEGKSYLLQYVTRKLRTLDSWRVVCISNPDLFLNSGQHNCYFLIILEIIYAFAADFASEEGAELKETSQGIHQNEKSCVSHGPPRTLKHLEVTSKILR